MVTTAPAPAVRDGQPTEYLGYEINAKPKFDFRNETSWAPPRLRGTEGAIDAGAS